MNPVKMSWNDYFKYKTMSRRMALVGAVPASIISLVSAASYVSTIAIDPTQTILGLDPLIWILGGTVGAGAAGGIFGSMMGTWIYKSTKKVNGLEEMEKKWFARVEKNRSEARFNSIRSPVPDYYGEKVSSLKDYRQWLRKQREHKKKAIFQ